MSQYLFVAAFISLGLATVMYVWHTVVRVRRETGAFAASSAAGGQVTTMAYRPIAVGRYATILAANGLAFLTLSLLLRALVTGHGPFSNMYEFSVAFAWGIVATHLYLGARYRARIIGTFVLPMAVALLAYAATLSPTPQPLVPALQNNLLLTLHVAVAIVAYGTFAVAFSAALLHLLQREESFGWLPGSYVLDELGYRSVVLGFPMMALAIILGALWANQAWGRYWGWDPKETASLVIWLIYGSYLHARTLRAWRGTRSAILLLLGFLAVLFTFFGNNFFGGLHSYSGLA